MSYTTEQLSLNKAIHRLDTRFAKSDRYLHLNPNADYRDTMEILYMDDEDLAYAQNRVDYLYDLQKRTTNQREKHAIIVARQKAAKKFKKI